MQESTDSNQGTSRHAPGTMKLNGDRAKVTRDSHMEFFRGIGIGFKILLGVLHYTLRTGASTLSKDGSLNVFSKDFFLWHPFNR